MAGDGLTAAERLELAELEELEMLEAKYGGDTMAENVKAFASGVPKGALDTLNFLGSANYYNPFSPSTFMNDRIYDDAQHEVDTLKGLLYEPQDQSERVLGSAGEFLGGDLVTMGAGKLLSAGRRGAQAATTWMGQKGDDLLRALTDNPKRQLMASVSGGLGAGVAREHTDSPYVELAAAMFGASMPDLISGSTGRLARLTSGGKAAHAQQQAGEALRGVVDDSFGPTLENALLQQADEPLGMYRSTAELTGDVGMAQLEKELASTGSRGTRYAARAADRAESRDSLLDALSPSSRVDTEELGDQLRSRGESVHKQMRAREEKIWSKFPRYEPIGVGPFQDDVARLVDERRGFGTNRLHSSIKKPITDLLSGVDPNMPEELGKGVLSSGALQDIRSELMAQLRDANLTPQDREVATAVINGIEDIFNKQLSGKSKGIWDAARGATRERAEMFSQRTSGGKLLDQRIGSDNILDKVVRGSRRSVKELRSAIDNDPDLLNDVKRAIIDDSRLRDADGVLTPAKVKRFLDTKGNGLRELFGEKHYKQMQQIADDLKSEASVQKLASFASKGQSATAQKLKTSSFLQRQLTGNMPGGGLAEEVISQIRQRHGNKLQERVNELLFEAAMNPRMAAELLKQPTPERLSLLQRWLIPMLLNESTRGGQAQREE